jgi:hypothetical protein
MDKRHNKYRSHNSAKPKTKMWAKFIADMNAQAVQAVMNWKPAVKSVNRKQKKRKNTTT